MISYILIFSQIKTKFIIKKTFQIFLSILIGFLFNKPNKDFYKISFLKIYFINFKTKKLVIIQK